MRRGFGLFGLVIGVILIAIVGVIAYNIGWSDGLGTHLPAAANGAAGAPPSYYYGYGPHYFGWGFGIFGLFWFLFILFGIFWLFRLAFWGRRWGGGWGGWGRGYYGHGIPPGIDQRMQEWHRQAHGEPAPPAGTTPPPPPDQRTV